MLKTLFITAGYVLILLASPAFAQTAAAPATTDTAPAAKTESPSATSWFSSLGDKSKASKREGGLSGQHHAHVYRDRNSSHAAGHAYRNKLKGAHAASADTTEKPASKSWFGTH